MLSFHWLGLVLAALLSNACHAAVGEFIPKNVCEGALDGPAALPSAFHTHAEILNRLMERPELSAQFEVQINRGRAEWKVPMGASTIAIAKHLGSKAALAHAGNLINAEETDPGSFLKSLDERSGNAGLAAEKWPFVIRPTVENGHEIVAKTSLGLYLDPRAASEIEGLWLLFRTHEYESGYLSGGTNWLPPLALEAIEKSLPHWLQEFSPGIAAELVRGPSRIRRSMFGFRFEHTAAIRIRGASSAAEYRLSNLHLLSRVADFVRRQNTPPTAAAAL